MEFSVCMSVYKNDIPQHVEEALDSMLVYQSIKPSEIVLVQDGLVSDELLKTIGKYEALYPKVMHVIRLEENKGLGNALRIGVENANKSIIARMDSDDISMTDRFSQQLTYLEAHPDVSIVGGQITEFIDKPSNVVGRRAVPLSNEDIIAYLKHRCPMNHVSVMFRRSEIQRVGGYLDWPWNEDYYLWVRMSAGGCIFANLPDVLVNVRVGKDMYSRRGGWPYFKSERGIQLLMLRNKMISLPRYCVNVLIRFCLQVLAPRSLRGWLYRFFARR